MTLLRTQDLAVHYGDFQALFGIGLEVAEGETVAIIGSNGAGKSTFLRSLAGLQAPSAGRVEFAGADITGMPANRVVASGLALVPEGRKLFPSLSVEENLLIGGYAKRKGPWSLERIYRIFPDLKEKRRNPGTALSGGQQQMVAIGRALMSNPRLLLCDELSLGLAPIVVKDIYARLPEILAEGTSVVVVEQDIGQAMKVADRFYCLQEGHVSLAGKPGEVGRDQVSAAYFGV